MVGLRARWFSGALLLFAGAVVSCGGKVGVDPDLSAVPYSGPLPVVGVVGNGGGAGSSGTTGAGAHHHGGGGAGGAAGNGGAGGVPVIMGTPVYSCEPLPLGVSTCIDGDCNHQDGSCPHLPPKCGGPNGRLAINFGTRSCFQGSCTGDVNEEHCPIACEIGTDDAHCTDVIPCNPYYWLSVCDPICQDCKDPAATKCTVEIDPDAPMPSGGMFGDEPPLNLTKAICTKASGAVGEDQPCQVTALGNDDCAPGLVCTDWGFAGSANVCRRFCHTPADCKQAGQVCVDLFAVQIPQAAVCVTPCTPFDDSTCMSASGESGTCSQLYLSTAMGQLTTTCRASVGPGAPGGSCLDDGQCGDNEVCLVKVNGATKCANLCDSTHPCAGGKTCHHFGPPTDAGYCP